MASSPPTVGALVAWDPVSEKAAWTATLPVAEGGGVLATAGNLVFEGRSDGILVAYRATDGKQLWMFDAGTGIMAPPVTYTVGGVQYISVLALDHSRQHSACQAKGGNHVGLQDCAKFCGCRIDRLLFEVNPGIVDQDRNRPDFIRNPLNQCIRLVHERNIVNFERCRFSEFPGGLFQNFHTPSHEHYFGTRSDKTFRNSKSKTTPTASYQSRLTLQRKISYHHNSIFSENRRLPSKKRGIRELSIKLLSFP